MTEAEDPAMERPTRDGGKAGRPSSAARRRCPICGEMAAERYRPFCSRRCADIDLGRWLKESYRVPTQDAPDAGDDSSGSEE